jgi:hypothetical protein
VGCPAKLTDRESTVQFMLTFYRRSTNSYADPDFLGCRATTLMMESNLADETGYAHMGLLDHEIPSSSVTNPAMGSENVRFFNQHAFVKNFIGQQPTSTAPSAVIHSVLFFSNLLVPISLAGLTVAAPPTAALSELTPQQAAVNRAHMGG